MHKNATFLILFGTLLVAGGFVLREREMMRERVVLPRVTPDQQGEDNQPNGGMDTASLKEVINPKINPVTGWKIFKHPDVPITFEYPGEMKAVSVSFIKKEYRTPGPSIVLNSSEHQLAIEFALPTEDGGYAWDFARKIEEVVLNFQGESYKLDLNQDYTPPEFFLVGTSLPTPFVGHISCRHYQCSGDKTLSLFKQFVSSIKIISTTQ